MLQPLYMNLHTQYELLYKECLPIIKNGQHETDSFLGAPIDNRYGLSLILQPSKEVNQEVMQFLSSVKEGEPNQYYYTPAQTHITVLSIISCCEGFQLDSIKWPDYARVVEASLQGIKAFEMNYRGITASKSGLLLQGYPVGDGLHQLRDQLRINFKASGLRESIDQRYKLTTAHATIMRFQKQLQDPARFVQFLQENRKRGFGTEMISKLHLVYNDWYHRPERTSVLKTFSI